MNIDDLCVGKWPLIPEHQGNIGLSWNAFGVTIHLVVDQFNIKHIGTGFSSTVSPTNAPIPTVPPRGPLPWGMTCVDTTSRVNLTPGLGVSTANAFSCHVVVKSTTNDVNRTLIGSQTLPNDLSAGFRLATDATGWRFECRNGTTTSTLLSTIPPANILSVVSFGVDSNLNMNMVHNGVYSRLAGPVNYTFGSNGYLCHNTVSSFLGTFYEILISNHPGDSEHLREYNHDIMRNVGLDP